jgi:hypothetical protein
MRRDLMLLGTLALLAACGGGSPNTTTTTDGAVLSDSAKAVATADSAKKAAAKVATPGARHMAIDTAALAGQRPMLRETYAYQGTSRDPFKSMLVVAQRGPELPDLKLVAIIYDSRSPSNSLVTFREIGSDRRYSWRPGQRVGRITVGEVSSTDVTLLQDDFGVVHRQTYTLRKTEDGNP